MNSYKRKQQIYDRLMNHYDFYETQQKNLEKEISRGNINKAEATFEYARLNNMKLDVIMLTIGGKLLSEMKDDRENV